jgi:hypothetical protein
MQSLKVYGDNAKLSRNTKNVLDIESRISEQTFEVYSPSVAHLLIGRSNVSNFFVNDKTDRHNMA